MKNNFGGIPDERLALSAYLRMTVKTVDGLAWLLTCIVALLCVLDLALKTNLLPFAPSNGYVILLFSPLMVFLVMVNLRQLPFSRLIIFAWIRAIACILLFIVLNF